MTKGMDLEIGLDGHIYGTAGGKFFKIDPADKEVTILRDSNSHFLAQDRMGNLYFKNGPSAPYGNTLWRYTLEDKTISVTGVTLDRTELNLSPGGHRRIEGRGSNPPSPQTGRSSGNPTISAWRRWMKTGRSKRWPPAPRKSRPRRKTAA